jgi:CheY-like chemotaxis protein
MSKTVLIIDDEPDVREFLSDVLEDHGYRTLTAADGVEGLQLARQEKPDLVILDLLMPTKTGTDFYRRLSQDQELADTPVIVVSGLAGRGLAVRQPAAVFDKPIDPDALISAVDRALA